MRINWQQQLEGCSLLEIRNILRALPSAESSFTAEFLARRLDKNAYFRSRGVLARARSLADGLIASGIIKIDDSGPRPSRSRFVLTDAGMSLRAATAGRRFKRARADKAVAKLLNVVAEINADPIFLHDIISVAVFGSYLAGEPDLGDIDVAVQLKARWKPHRGLLGLEKTDLDRRREAFEARYPPPDSFYRLTRRSPPQRGRGPVRVSCAANRESRCRCTRSAEFPKRGRLRPRRWPRRQPMLCKSSARPASNTPGSGSMTTRAMT